MKTTSTKLNVLTLLPKDTGRQVSTESENIVAEPRTDLDHGNRAAIRTAPPRILLAEDDREMRRLLSTQLQRAGFDVVECRDGERLVQQLASVFLPSAHRNGFDLVISDIRMPGFSGLEVLDGLHDRPEFPPMILITAFGTAETHARARRLGAVATLNKPFRIPDLVTFVHGFMEKSQHPPGPRPMQEPPLRGTTAPRLFRGDKED